MNLMNKLKNAIRDIKDYPKRGILFKDITPVLLDPLLNLAIVDEIAAQWEGVKIEGIAGIESRGFIWGNMLATKMRVPFIPVRKHGKLPYNKISESYDLEYGSATIEIHSDAVGKGQKILIHDDLLATGGTANASKNLISRAGGEVVGYSFVVELAFLEGHLKLKEPVRSLIAY